MADTPNKLSFDAGGADAAINSVINLFTRYNNTLAAVTHQHVELDSEGRILKATLEALTATGSAFYINLAKTEKGLGIVSTAAKNAESNLQRLQKQAERNAQALKAATFIDTRAGLLNPDVKVGDKLGLDRLAAQMVGLARQGKLTSQELENIYRLVEAGNKTTYKDPGFEDARRKIVQYQLELTRLNAQVAKGQQAKVDTKAAYGILQNFRTGVLGGSSATDLLGFDKSSQSLLNFVRAGKISATEFQGIFAQIQAGATATFLDKLPEDVRLGVVRMTREFERLKDIDAKRISVASGKSNARFVPDNIRSTFGDLPGNATQRSSDLVAAASAKIKAAFESGKLDSSTYASVVTAVMSKSGSSFTGWAETARRALTTVRNEYARLEAAAKKEADTQTTQQRRNRLATAVGKRLDSTLGAKEFDERGLQAYYNQVAKIQQLIRNGGLDGGKFTNAFRAFNDGAGPLAGGEEKIRRSLVQIGTAFKDVETKAEQAGRIANQAFSLIQAQILYNSLQNFADEFDRLVHKAAEFQTHIALIQTISQDADVSFNEWAAGIARVSDELGRPIIDVAIAGYDALSNQVTRAADTFNFLRTSGQFARITNSSVKDSVDLLSSALNAFQIPTADAERVAASFFTTIDLGRVKAQELGGTFGRVAVFAHSLGISLEELGGAISVISRQGIEAQTTQTLLNNVFQKLLNPTKQLQELYDKLGVGTGEAFVKTYGFIGALEKLKEAAGGSKDKLADFFNEIRGFQGANTLIDRLDDLKKDISEHLNSGSKIDVAKGLFQKNAGQQLIDELNKVENYFRTGFETHLLEAVLNITNAVGGISGIFKSVFGTVNEVLKTAGFAAAGFIATLAVVKIAAFTTSLFALGSAASQIVIAFTNLKFAVTAFLSSPIGIIATIGVGIGLLAKNAYDASNAMAEVAKSAREVARSGIEAERSLFSQDLLKRRKEFEAGLNTTQQAVLKLAQAARKELTTVGEAQKKLGHDISQSVQNGMELVLGDIKRIGHELDALQKKSQESVKKARESIFDSYDDQQQQKFERAKKILEVNRSNDEASNSGKRSSEFDSKELDLYQTRVQQIDVATRKAFAAGDIERGNALFKEKVQLLDELATVTKSVPIIGIDQLGNTQQIGQGQRLRFLGIENQLTDAYAQQRDLLKEQIALQSQQAETARKALEAQQERIKILDDLAKDIGKFDPFNSEGDLNLKKYKTLGEAIDELTKKQEKFLEVAGASQDPHGSIATRLTFTEQRDKLREKFKQQTGNATDQVTTKKKVDQLDKLRDSALEAPNKALEGFDSLGRKAGESEEKILRLRAEIKELFLILGGNVHDKNQGFFKDPQGLNTKAIGAIQTAYESFDKSLTSGNVKQAIADLETYSAALRQAKLSGSTAVPETKTNPAQTASQVVGTLKTFLNELDSAQSAKSGTISILEKFVAESKALDPVVSQVQAKFVELGIKGVEGLNPVNAAIGQTTTGLDGMINKLDAASRAWDVLNKTAKEQGAPTAPTTVTPPTVEHKAMGGYVGHLAAGGMNSGFLSDFWSGMYAKGTDIIPTMVGRKEIVMNARASGKFAPQLQAMNRGQTPQGSSKPATSNSVNVHTTVNVAKAGSDDIGKIVAGINRASRRGQFNVKG